MLIDSHCHLDASEFAPDREQVWAQARAIGVERVIVPAVHPDNFQAVAQLARDYEGVYYALGIHPMYVRYCATAESEPETKLHTNINKGSLKNKNKDSLIEPALKQLEQAVEQALEDPKFIGIGEIGLDFFVPEISAGAQRERQEFFYQEQLKMAQRYDLPVILHVRRSQDTLLKYLRRIRVPGGIAHAFNGSKQQAQAFIDLGFCLGFGGTLTYARSLQIRRLATELDVSHLVLETDAPDIPPAWLEADGAGQRRNSPEYLARIAQDLAELREMPYAELVAATGANVLRVLPRLK